MTKESSTWLVCLAFVGASTMAAAAMTLRPPAQGAVAAVFPPWWSGDRAIAAAASAGAVVRYGNFDFVVVVLPDHPAARRELNHAGAWLLLDPQALGLCLLPADRTDVAA